MIPWWWLLAAFWLGILFGVALYAALLYRMSGAKSVSRGAAFGTDAPLRHETAA